MVGACYPCEGWPRRSAAWRRVLAAAVVAAALAPATAWLAGPDELALTIQQNLEGIQFRLGISPERAVGDLDEQKRQLRLLETQAPDHPMVPELVRQVERLEEQAAKQLGGEGGAGTTAGTGTGAASATAPASEVLGPSEAPEEVADRLREVERRLREAESGMMQGQADAAAESLDRADALVAEIESDYGDAIPTGHVPLIVAKERINVLKDQLGRDRPAE